MDSLREAVTWQVVGSGVVEGKVVLLADVLERFGDELASVVCFQEMQHSKIRCVFAQRLYYIGGVYCFKWEELSVTGIVVNDRKNVSRILCSLNVNL